MVALGKNLPANAGDMGLISGSGRSLEKEMVTHSSNSIHETMSKGTENTNSKICLHPHVYSSVIYSSQDMRTI